LVFPHSVLPKSRLGGIEVKIQARFHERIHHEPGLTSGKPGSATSAEIELHYICDFQRTLSKVRGAS